MNTFGLELKADCDEERQGAVVPSIADAEIVKFVQDEPALWTKTVTELNICAD